MSYYDNVILGAPPDDSDETYFRLEAKVLELLRSNGLGVIAKELEGSSTLENALNKQLKVDSENFY